MKKDVSNQTVLILAILAILISVLSVATIHYEASKISTDVVYEDGEAMGTISLEIASEPQKDASSGSISLDIANNESV